MTECERIIHKGLLPKEFFKDETICDFHITTERKKNWAICIDLLAEFDRVCSKHQLRYFVAFGSLLGIVRHNGFIPWDDDMDICMLREDYDKLMRLKNEYEAPYFLQKPGDDHDYWFSFSKLRNKNTTAVPIPFRYAHFNQGIGIDIFPLDNCIPDLAEEIQKEVNELVLENSANMRRSNPYPTEADLKRCAMYPESNPQNVNRRIETLARQHNSKQTVWVTCATLTVYNTKRLTFLRNDVTDLLKAHFYGLEVPIPRNYHRVLSTTYGDYMKFPPVDKRGIWHSNLVLNPDVPYEEVIRQLKQNDNQQQ